MTRIARPIRLLYAAAIVAIAGVAGAQETRESVQIGLSTDKIGISANFSGAQLTIFGSIENLDPTVARQGGYDIIAVLEGPSGNVTVNKKERAFGIWITRAGESFENVPVSYSMASTRQLQDITTEESYRRLALGPDRIALTPAKPDEPPSRIAEFSDALRQIKVGKGLYNMHPGDVRFLSQNLFRANLALPADIPVGTHRARAFLFKKGAFVAETSENLTILKTGVEADVYDFARTNGLLYGIVAVLVAMLTGWLGRILFRKD